MGGFEVSSQFYSTFLFVIEVSSVETAFVVINSVKLSPRVKWISTNFDGAVESSIVNIVQKSSPSHEDALYLRQCLACSQLLVCRINNSGRVLEFMECVLVRGSLWMKGKSGPLGVLHVNYFQCVRVTSVLRCLRL